MAADAQPFAADAPKVWTIPPGTDFLGSLASVLVETFGLKAQPDALSNAVIYVPNRRSARALALALFDALGEGATLLPPDIRTLGDLESDDAPPVAEAAAAVLAPAVAPARRLGVLAKLAGAFYTSEYGLSLPPASALAAARELSRLLEQTTLGETAADWSQLTSLAQEGDIAGHWRDSAKFLSILTEMWPQWLAENNAADPFQRRLMAAEAMAAQWAKLPPAAPVIIAGSTGATPSGRALMRAALQLRQGCVVLPGLDTDLSGDAEASVSVSPSHPQFTLVRTLRLLGIPLGDVKEWPTRGGLRRPPSRRRLVFEALAPADDTADWRATLDELAESGATTAAKFVSEAIEGLSVVELPNEAAEAEAAALLLRGVLETPKATGALVTPDAGLARRVGALMARWGLSVPPSAGQPLSRTPAGSLISLCARWTVDPSDPVALSAVLKHPFVREREAADLLDLHFLRGVRRWRSLEALAVSIETRHLGERRPAFSPTDQVQAAALVRRVAVTLQECGADFSGTETVPLAEGAQRIAALAGAISETPLPWAGEDGAGASTLLQRINEMGVFLGEVTPQEMAELVERECAGLTVSLGETEHPRLSIWGPLEARLQSADLVVLAGLNEDVWPEKTPPDAFLPRRFRAGIGLPDADERLGLSAHDFAQLACAPKVVMLHSARRDDAPAVASRWVWRLRTLVQGALGDAAPSAMAGEWSALPQWVEALQARGIDPGAPRLSVEPRPTRRPEGWPKRMSVTRIDRLQRDPYAIWAEDIAGLRTLDPMNGPMQANLKGTAVHKAIERFELEPGPRTAEDLAALLRAELRASGEAETDWLSREAIWKDVAAWFLNWRAGRDASGGLALEVSGKLDYTIAGLPFTLAAQADRIETSSSGTITIVDFKTGTAATDKMIKAGVDQQMPLQALIATRGGFEKVRAGAVGALEYVEFKGRPSSRPIGPGADGALTPDRMLVAAETGVRKLIAEYRAPGAAFVSAPRVQFVKYDYGYNLLARRAEWTSDTSDGEGSDE